MTTFRATADTARAATNSAVTAARSALAAIHRALDSFGAGSSRIRRSLPAPPIRASFAGRRFSNAEPDSRVPVDAYASLLWTFLTRSRTTPMIPVERPEFPTAAADLAAMWLGHATVLLEIDGYRVLADPVLGERVSPADFMGPRRLHPVPLTVADLPPLDAVVISHDHYDHLDRDTVRELAAATSATFLVPLGIGAHLRHWHVPAERIVEFDWGGQHRIGSLTVTCTPARHFSGRGVVNNTTLWASWALAGPVHRAYFGGDTGYTPAFAEIGREYGPFDLTMLPVGAYDAAWPDIHMTPEQVVQAHHDLGGTALLPIHWATFNLAPHPWAEPIERLQRASRSASIATPRPGERILPRHPANAEPWWRTAQANPSHQPGR